MKKYTILTIIFFLALFTFPVVATEQPQSSYQQTASPTWIEVGTVVGECYDHDHNWYLTGPKELKLYVMYLGEKLIYRVEWNGNSYPVVKSDPDRNRGYNAYARIPGWVYKYKNNTDGTRKKITDGGIVVFNVPSW